MSKKISYDKIITYVVIITLILSVFYSAINVVLAPVEVDKNVVGSKAKSDYVLMLLQCVFGVVIFFLPTLIERRMKIEIPSKMYLAFIVFLYCAIYLGEIHSFYYLIPYWDVILHTFSGAMLGALGFSLVTMLNDYEYIQVKMSPVFIALFAFCFSIMLGAIWEIYEFAADGLLGTNMQKFLMVDGTPLIGRAALVDTMKDIIVDVLGSLGITIIGYISLKTEDGWLDKFHFKKKRETH